jgi:hypothetical protein
VRIELERVMWAAPVVVCRNSNKFRNVYQCLSDAVGSPHRYVPRICVKTEIRRAIAEFETTCLSGSHPYGVGPALSVWNTFAGGQQDGGVEVLSNFERLINLPELLVS